MCACIISQNPNSYIQNFAWCNNDALKWKCHTLEYIGVNCVILKVPCRGSLSSGLKCWMWTVVSPQWVWFQTSILGNIHKSSLFCHERMDATLIAVQEIWSFLQQLVSLALQKDHKQEETGWYCPKVMLQFTLYLLYTHESNINHYTFNKCILQYFELNF